MALRPHHLHLFADLGSDESILRVENKLGSSLCSLGSVQPAPARRAPIIRSLPAVHALHAASALGVSLGLSRGVELTRGRVAPTVTDGRVLSALLKQAPAFLGRQELELAGLLDVVLLFILRTNSLTVHVRCPL